MDEQHRCAVRVVVQDLQCLPIALDRRIANDVDRVAVRPVGRQHRVQLRQRGCAEFGQRHVDLGGRVGGHHAGAAAIGEDGERLTAVGAKARQRLRRQEQLLQAVHAQHAGTRNGGVIHRIGPGQGASVRGCRLLTLRRSAALDDDDGLVACRRARGRHELARRLDRLDVEQDRARARVGGQIVEHVAKIHVGMLAERHEMRKPDALRVGPVQHGRHQRARLRHKGQFAGLGVDVREARVQADVRRQQADAIGAQQAQQARPCGVQHVLPLGGRHPGAQHHGRPRAFRGQLVDQARHGGRRGANDCQLGRARQIGDAGMAGPAIERCMLRVDRVERPLETATREVAPDRGAHAGGPGGGADHRDGGRVEQGIEVADTHGKTCR